MSAGACWPGCRAWLSRSWLLWNGVFEPRTQWPVTVLIVAAGSAFAFAVRERVVFPLQTLSNLLGALREGDYSVRGRAPRPDDALGEVMHEVNTLGSTLREQRLGAMEATMLLRTVMREIDVAIFAFDERRRLRLVNRAGERLLAMAPERLLGQTAAELESGGLPRRPGRRAPCRWCFRAARAAGACAARAFANADCRSNWSSSRTSPRP